MVLNKHQEKGNLVSSMCNLKICKSYHWYHQIKDVLASQNLTPCNVEILPSLIQSIKCTNFNQKFYLKRGLGKSSTIHEFVIRLFPLPSFLFYPLLRYLRQSPPTLMQLHADVGWCWLHPATGDDLSNF